MQFNGIWPTYLLSRRLPGHEESNKGLEAHIAQQEGREKDYTARYQEQNFFSSKNPAVKWLEAQVNETVTAFLQQMGVEKKHTWTLFAWYNINRYGDHHAPHTHPHSYLSGTYYLRMPPPATSDDPRARPGCISFFDPRTGANMVTVGPEPDAQSSYPVYPSAGTLLMWPSPLQHQVHPNLSQDQRITISVNVIVDRWKK
jgi:uncharacterized protein (TIGR02466 family)